MTQRGLKGEIRPAQDSIFDPEARFRSRVGGTGEAPGTGLVGPGEIDVDVSDVIDAKTLFSIVA